MRVSADYGHTGKRQSLLRTHHVDYAVARIHHPEICQAEFPDICIQCLQLFPRNRILNRLVLIVGGGIVVRHTEDALRTETLDAPCTQAFESLW